MMHFLQGEEITLTNVVPDSARCVGVDRDVVLD